MKTMNSGTCLFYRAWDINFSLLQSVLSLLDVRLKLPKLAQSRIILTMAYLLEGFSISIHTCINY